MRFLYVCAYINIHTSIFIYLYKMHCTFIVVFTLYSTFNWLPTSDMNFLNYLSYVCLSVIPEWLGVILLSKFPQIRVLRLEFWWVNSRRPFQNTLKNGIHIFLFSFFLPTLHSVSNCRLPEGGECVINFLVSCFKTQVVYPTSIY